MAFYRGFSESIKVEQILHFIPLMKLIRIIFSLSLLSISSIYAAATPSDCVCVEEDGHEGWQCQNRCPLHCPGIKPTTPTDRIYIRFECPPPAPGQPYPYDPSGIDPEKYPHIYPQMPTYAGTAPGTP
jgi:hypothetical protein